MYRLFQLLRVLIIVHEEIKIEGPRKPHQPGLDKYKQHTVHRQPYENAVIPPGYPEKQPEPDQVKHTESHRKRVTHIACPKPETGFQLIFLPAYRTIIIHIKDPGKSYMKRIPVPEHISLPASGAFHCQHACKIAWALRRLCTHAAKIIFFFQHRIIQHSLILCWKNSALHHFHLPLPDLLPPHRVV